MHVAGLDQSFLDLLFVLLFVKQRPILSGGQLKLEIHMMLDDRLQGSSVSGLAVRHRQHVDAEGVLQPGLLVEHVDEILRVRAFFRAQERCGCPPWRTGWKYPRYPSSSWSPPDRATSFKNLPILAPIIV